jgi:hypothetical protein
MRVGLIHGRSALVLTCATILALSAGPAHASGTLDAACTAGSTGFTIFSNGGRTAAVFTAGRSGKLLTVDLKSIARASGGSGGDITVELHSVDGSGTPTDPVLVSTAIPSASIPADSFARDFSADFAPASAQYLVGGQKYAIAVTTADSAQNSWGLLDGDPCPGIEVFQRFSSWSQQFTAGADVGFATSLGPPNDDFGRAEVLSGENPSTDGTTAGGTRQDPDEPDHYTIGGADTGTWVGDHTVWYRWTALGSGPTTMDTCTANIDSILAVYIGIDIASLTRITDNNNACAAGYGSKVTFDASVATSYAIAVGDAGGARESTFTLNVDGVAAPSTTSTTTVADSTSTSSTTLPGCGAVATYASIDCRLDDLVASLDAAQDLGRLKSGLVNAATKARTKKQQAEGSVATGKKKQEKKAMKKAVKALTSFLHRASSRSARKLIPPATRHMLTDQTNRILADMKTLLGTL